MSSNKKHKRDDNAIYFEDLEKIEGADFSNSSAIMGDNTSDDMAIKFHDLIGLIKLREQYVQDEKNRQEEIAKINAQIDFQLKEKMNMEQNALLQRLYEARIWEIQNNIFEMQQRHSQQMIRTAMMAAYTQYKFG